MKTVQDFAEHIVRQGASTLDLISRDWDTRVNVDTLDIASNDRCVIAQAFGDGDFLDGGGIVLELLEDIAPGGYDQWSLVKLGFHSQWLEVDLAEFPDVWTDDGEVYLSDSILTSAWKKIITERRAAVAMGTAIQDFAEHVVRQGASMLDLISRDWDTRVDLDVLDIGSDGSDVIAQAFGDGDFLADTGFHADWLTGDGLQVGWTDVDIRRFPDVQADGGRVYLTGGVLTEAWKKIITERRAAVAMDTAIQDFAEHVARQGASTLDLISRDWDTRVDLDVLDIGSNDRCVIAQAFGEGDFMGGRVVVMELLDDIAPGSYSQWSLTKLGFRATWLEVDRADFPDVSTDDGRIYLTHKALDEAWKKIITERRAARV